MCFVDTSVSVDVDPDSIDGNQYKCKECKNTFKALGKKVSCPACESGNIEKI